MGTTGKDCNLNHPHDAVPWQLLWMITICARCLSLFYPINNCDYMVNSEAQGRGRNWSTHSAMINMGAIALLSSAIITLLDEAWDFWDPFNRAINTYSWSLGIARELDMILNDFYEVDASMLSRKHAYMDIPGPNRESKSGSTCAPSQRRNNWEGRFSM